MRTSLKAVVVGALVFATLLPSRIQAQTATFTFEAPQFTFGQTTPLLNQAPNVGDPTLLASFTDATNPNSYQIDDTSHLSFDANIQGQYLVNLNGTGSLQIAFSKPITQFSVDYATNMTIAGPADTFQAMTSQGLFTSAAGDHGSDFQTGTLSFSTALPFTSVTLSAVSSTGAEAAIAIDNLQIGTAAAATPEPSSAALLLGMTAAGTAFLRRRKNARKAA